MLNGIISSCRQNYLWNVFMANSPSKKPIEIYRINFVVLSLLFSLLNGNRVILSFFSTSSSFLPKEKKSWISMNLRNWRQRNDSSVCVCVYIKPFDSVMVVEREPKGILCLKHFQFRFELSFSRGFATHTFRIRLFQFKHVNFSMETMPLPLWTIEHFPIFDEFSPEFAFILWG